MQALKVSIEDIWFCLIILIKNSVLIAKELDEVTFYSIDKEEVINW